MPRKKIFDETRRAELFAAVSAGLNLTEAARFLGCSIRTIQNTAKREPDFARQLRDAELSARLDPLKRMHQAAASHWRAAAWLLERSDPERFSPPRSAAGPPRAQVEHSFASLIEIALEEIPDAAARRRAFARLSVAAEQSTREICGNPARRSERAAARRQPLSPLTSDQRLQNVLDAAGACFGPFGDAPPHPAAPSSEQPRLSEVLAPASPAEYFPLNEAPDTENSIAPFLHALSKKVREKMSACRAPSESEQPVFSPRIASPTGD
jgi:hypothetical protein